jgi:hypothetical protein
MKYFIAVCDSKTKRFQGFVDSGSLKRDAIRHKITRTGDNLVKMGKPFEYKFK